MRKKSPASIQKWVDSCSIPSTSNASNNETAFEDTTVDVTVLQEKLDSDVKDESKSCYSTVPEHDDASTSLNDNLNDNKKAFSYHENLKEIGKQKINEFCDRFSKNKKIGLKNLFQSSVSKLKSSNTMDVCDVKQEIEEKLLETENSNNAASSSCSENKENMIFEMDDDKNCDNSEKVKTAAEMVKNTPEVKMDSNLLNVSKNQMIGVIGRSSSENPNPISKRFRLNDIGRSFSVQEPEDPNKNPIDSNDNLIYDIDDGSSTKSNLGAASLATSSRSINSNNNLNSYVKSVPISPIHRTFREEHLSESHSSRAIRNAFLMRDSSFQSDSSHCSSVESLLESRKPNAEEILVNLGFGPPQTEDLISKIPVRFLKPSQVRGVDVEAFLRQQQLAYQIHENSVLGYRGLLGTPDSQASGIVNSILERFSKNELEKMESAEAFYMISTLANNSNSKANQSSQST